jgi:hypothetical protein
MNHYVVFDLDDTLGCFPAMSRDMFESRQRNPELNETARFNMLMEINPYVRPQMVSLLRFLQQTKQVRPVSVVVYTNNPSTAWVNHIVQYLNRMVGAPVIDKVIDATRGTLEKSVANLFACLKVKKPKDLRLFFVDDQWHENMLGDTIKYYPNDRLLYDGQTMYYHIPPYAEPNVFDFAPTEKLGQLLVRFFNQ